MTKIVLAYDMRVWDPHHADLFEAIAPEIGMLKVGLEAMSSDKGTDGRSVAAMAAGFFLAAGGKVLWDAKLHDIPNTIAGAVRALAGRYDGVTIHASAGPSGLVAAVEARTEVLGPPMGISPDDTAPWLRLFGVTVLTSFDYVASSLVYNTTDIRRQVLQFATHLADCGVDGVVCSAHELEALQDAGLASKFKTLVPGIRPAYASDGDQKRVMTPADAARLKADFIVVGRPILKGPYPPLEAAKRINDEMASAC